MGKKRGSVSLIVSSSSPRQGETQRPEGEWAGGVGNMPSLPSWGLIAQRMGKAQKQAQAWYHNIFWAPWVEGGAAASTLLDGITHE